MIHMLSAFDLKDGEKLETFRKAYAEFLKDLEQDDLIVAAGPVGIRVSDTPMDTNGGATQRYFSTMSFRDRAQLDAAYARIEQGVSDATGAHKGVILRIENAVFTCWQEDSHQV